MVVPFGLREFTLPSGFAWTASKLNSYETCAYRFAWEQWARYELPFDPNKHGAFGMAVHAGIEWLWKQPGPPAEWPHPYKALEVYRDKFCDTSDALRWPSKRKWKWLAQWAASKNCAPCRFCAGNGCDECAGLGYAIPAWLLLGYESPDEVINWYERGARMIWRHHAQHVSRRSATIQHWSEQKFTFYFEGYEFRGYIDRIDYDASLGTTLVVDYKTGRKSGSAEENARDLQMWCYATRMITGEGGRAEDMDLDRLHYLWVAIHNVEKNEFEPIRYSPALWRRNAEKAKRIMSLAATGSFLPRPSGLCNWCSVPECPDRKK